MNYTLLHGIKVAFKSFCNHFDQNDIQLQIADDRQNSGYCPIILFRSSSFKQFRLIVQFNFDFHKLSPCKSIISKYFFSLYDFIDVVLVSFILSLNMFVHFSVSIVNFEQITIKGRYRHCVKSVQIRSFFWSVFSRIWTEYGEILRISPYPVRMQEIQTRRNSVLGHISHSEDVKISKFQRSSF